jgi:hypothetical protein
MTTGERLVSEFQRMVRRDGGSLMLLSEEPRLIRVGYRAGNVHACGSGACILPHTEIQQLMSETLATRDPNQTVEVVPLADADG